MIYNNIVTDAFFLKAMTLNTEPEGNDSAQYFGDVCIGCNYRMVVTDLQDRKFILLGNQAFQATYSSLMLPYAFLGVGRSNNYIEYLYVASSVEGHKSERMWTPIIPNSQLIVFADSHVVDNWALELFISPTQQLYLIVASCCLALIVIGIVIIVLHCKEKQEDKRKRDTNFDFL